MKKSNPSQTSSTELPTESPERKRQPIVFNLTVLLFPDGTRVRLSEFETYQPDGPKDSPNGVTVRLRSGRTLLWSPAGATAEQKTKHAKDILQGLDQIFGRRNLVD